MLAFINLSSPMHVLLILAVALLLFGSRLPEVARSMGKAINEFKRGLREVEDDARPDEAETPPAQPAAKLNPPKDGVGVSRSRGDDAKVAANETSSESAKP